MNESLTYDHVTTYNKDVLFSIILQERNSGRAWLGGSSAPFGVGLSHLLGCSQLALACLGWKAQEDFSHLSMPQDSSIGCPLSLSMWLTWAPSQQGGQICYTATGRKGRWQLLGLFQAGPRAGMVSLLPHSVGQSKLAFEG